MIEYDPNNYLNYMDLSNLLQSISKKMPRYFRLNSIGKSRQGRDVWAMIVTDFDTGSDKERPGYWVSGNIHAAELAGGQAAVELIVQIYSGIIENNLKILKLLSQNSIYVVPRISPDGAEAVLKGENHRSVDVAYPDPEAPGWVARDMDGDGVIRRLLVEDPGGNWRKSKRDPRILLWRKPNENDPEEIYFSQKVEGLRDAENIKEPMMKLSSGLDYNRNFPTHWKPEGQQAGAGPFPLSSPETHAVLKFIETKKNIVGAQDFHTYSGIILRPGVHQRDEDLPPIDLFVLKSLGQVGTDITGYPCLSIKEDFCYSKKQDVSGGFIDHLYLSLGIYTFSNEIWSVHKASGVEIPPKGYIPYYFSEFSEEDQLKVFKFLDEHGDEDWFLPWQRFEHPQLGPVEIGGANMLYSFRNPPRQLLGAEVKKNAEFVLACIEANPRVEVIYFGFERVGPDIFLVSIKLKNNGFVSTEGAYTERGARSVPESYVRLKYEETLKIEHGEAYQKVPPLAGRSRTAPIANSVFATFSEQPTNIWEGKWTVKGKGSLTLECNYYKGGVIRKSLKLD